MYLGLMLIFVVVMTGTFAYYQEARSSSIMASFKDLIPHTAFVRRNGVVTEVNPKFLVVGDIVELTGGNQIPADIMIIESKYCLFQAS